MRPTANLSAKTSSHYFQTAPRTDDPFNFFANGFEPFLEWAAAPKAPLIHLTGLSGSGKSSLISAFLKPRLESITSCGKTVVFTIRSYRDPLTLLKDALLSLWKKPPTGYQSLSPNDALVRAARQMDPNGKMLVVLDQFEEFFILRATLQKEGNNAETDEETVAAFKTELLRLHDFFKTFLANPPSGVTLVLVYREDYRRLLGPLALPLRQEGVNWMTVDPLDFTAAKQFLASCPGLIIPDSRMERVLSEAARQDGNRMVMRPIVANLLGMVLRRMSNHPTLWNQKTDLLLGYVRACMGREMTEDSALVMRALLTDYHTARPRSIDEIARETGLDATALDSQLEHFGRAGLLRCVNADENVQGRRVWQISHDFLATLIERVLDRMHRTIWRSTRAWLAPGMFIVSFVTVFFVHRASMQRDVSLLANKGFMWIPAESAIVVEDKGRTNTSLSECSIAIKHLNPVVLDLHSCKSLANVDGLYGLHSLQSLDISRADRLDNVNGLSGLSSLTNLNLASCGTLQNVNGLKGQSSLQTLDLSGCASLSDINGLSGLLSLKHLVLDNCSEIQSVEGLRGSTSLEYLSLVWCGKLRNVDPLGELSSLRRLNLEGCSAIRSVEFLKKLSLLQYLNLEGNGLDLNPIKSLTSLRDLHIVFGNLRDIRFVGGLLMLTNFSLDACFGLRNVQGMEHLSQLQKLQISQCHELQKIEDLGGLVSLRELDLLDCRSLTNLDFLRNLKSLEILKLRGCSGLLNIDALQNCESLRDLDVAGCQQLQTLAPLAEIKSLMHLNLSDCGGLQTVDVITNLTSLMDLDCGGCKLLKNLDKVRGLILLTNLSLNSCSALQNVDGIKGLPALRFLNLLGCDSLSKTSQAELVSALPKTVLWLRSGTYDYGRGGN